MEVTARQSPHAATVIAWVMPHLLAHLAARGDDASLIRALPGLRGRDLDDPDMRVADSAAAEAWRVAEQVTGDAALGLHMAQWIPAGALDVLEYAVRSSRTLGAGLEQLARYGRALGERTAAALSFEDETVVVTWGGSTQAQREEFALAFVVRLAREATGTAIVPIAVSFTHAAPAHVAERSEFFGGLVRFEQPAPQLRWRRSDAALALRSADAGLSSVVRRRLEKMLAQLPRSDDSTPVRVRRALVGTLARGEPTAASIGRELGLSERTLHRRLRAEGQSFRAILHEIRGELATGLLAEPGVGIGEIAFFLGYSEPAAFHRFFRRWSGRTPLQFRQASQALVAGR